MNKQNNFYRRGAEAQSFSIIVYAFGINNKTSFSLRLRASAVQSLLLTCP